MTVLIQDIQRTLGATGQTYNLSIPTDLNVSLAVNNNGAGVSVTVKFLQQPGGTQSYTVDPYTSRKFRNMDGVITITLTGSGANISLIASPVPEEIDVQPINIQQTTSPTATDPRYLALYDNRYFATVIFAQAPAAATQRVLFRLRNPPNSATNLIITLIRVVCNAARGFWIATNNPTGGLTNPQARINKAAAASGLSTSKGLPSFVNNLTTDPSNVIHHETLQANVPTEYREPLLIKPGTGTDPVAAGAIDIQVGDVADATTDLMTVEIEWYEEPAL